MNYANKLEIPFVVFIGEDEAKAKQATLKNFKNSPTDFNNEDAGKLVKSLF